MYAFAADMVTVIHAALVIGVLLGILISVKYRRFRPIESFILLAAIVIWSLYDGCPLTYLENYLRYAADAPIDLLDSGFIPYYVNHWFGASITNRELTITTYVTAFVFLIISMEWMKPFVHMEVLKVRRAFKK